MIENDSTNNHHKWGRTEGIIPVEFHPASLGTNPKDGEHGGRAVSSVVKAKLCGNTREVVPVVLLNKFAKVEHLDMPRDSVDDGGG